MKEILKLARETAIEVIMNAGAIVRENITYIVRNQVVTTKYLTGYG